jgi:uncharacterized protein (DUF885 family)
MNSSAFVKPAFLFALTLLLTACERGAEASRPVAATPAPAEATTMTTEQQDQRLLAFFDEIFERDVAQSPEFQAQLGRKTEDYGRWDDHSESWAVSRNQQVEADLRRLHEEFDYEALGPTAQLSYRIFEYDQQRALRNFPWRHHDYAVTQMDNIASSIPTFLQNLHKVETRQDAEAYIARLAGVETVMAQYVELLRLRESRGVVPPILVYPRVLPAAGNMLQGAPFEETAEDGIVLADFRGKLAALALDAEEQEILLNDAANALSGPFRAGYTALIEDLTRLQGLADDNNGIWDLPDAAAYYSNRVQNWTTLERPAGEIHELGLAEVARIRGEMQQIMAEVGFAGDLPAFFDHVRTEPENYYPNTDAGRQEYLREATALIEGIYGIADDWFNVLPKAPLEVRRVEPWRESGSSTAFYNRPAPDGSRPGIFYVNMQDMNAVQKHIMNSLAYHEGAPGHHFQLAIQQELQGVPEFRKYRSYGVYSEGWALYAERLAFEAGLYEDLPMRNFGRLSEEMKRAVRLVVDSGMHSKRWSREQCIEYMTANTPMAPADIERQIERYFVDPGQALSYKVGMLTILELRERAKSALGEDFDVREFHDAVLKNGAVPLEILEQVIDGYIAAKGGGQPHGD